MPPACCALGHLADLRRPGAGHTLLAPRSWAGLLAHPALWLLALSSGLTNVAFNTASSTGDVVRVILLFYLMPAWAVLLAWKFLGERPTPRACCAWRWHSPAWAW
jgi:drug/metabolite transporter (DMT)-like permease